MKENFPGISFHIHRPELFQMQDGTLKLKWADNTGWKIDGRPCEVYPVHIYRRHECIKSLSRYLGKY